MSKRSLVSVICPSRLQLDLRTGNRALLAEKAFRTVRTQTAWETHDCELILALDPGVSAPASLASLRGMKVTNGERPGQAAAMNAGVKASRGAWICFIEDDDTWNPLKLAVQLQALAGTTFGMRRRKFASSNQIEIDVEGRHVQVNDFATPSGWLMGRDVWERVGPFDESFRWHLDSEWLSRLNASGIPRVHLVDRARPPRDLLMFMAKYSHVEETGLVLPLVSRLVNPEGGMSKIQRDPESARQSRDEYRRIRSRFGEVSW